MGSSERLHAGMSTERTDVQAPSTSSRYTAADRWSPSTPPAQEWQSQWHSAIPELEELARYGSLHAVLVIKRDRHRGELCANRRRTKPADVVIMRASQLDAARLDTELTAMLKEQFLKVFTYFQPRVITALQPELSLILQLLVISSAPTLLDFCLFLASVYLQHANANRSHLSKHTCWFVCTADFQVFSMGRQAYTWQCSHEPALQG